MNKVALYGERCSGTNLVAELLRRNAGAEIVYPLGFKHFPIIPDESVAREKLSGSVTVIMSRHPEAWLSSLFVNPWHACDEVRELGFSEFLRSEWKSIWGEESGVDRDDPRYGNPIEGDLNPCSSSYYASPIQLRNGKHHIFKRIHALSPKAVWVKLEDLAADQEKTFSRICTELGLPSAEPFKEVQEYKGTESFKRRILRRFQAHRVFPRQSKEKPQISPQDRRYIWSELDRDIEQWLEYSPLGPVDR